MKQNFYINSKLKDLISNIIYDVQNYNSIITKYIDLERCANNYCSESRATIVRQSFLINRTMESLSDFNDINSDSFKLNMNFENISVIINEALDSVFDLFKSKRTKIKLDDKILTECIVLMDRDKIKRSILNIFSFICGFLKYFHFCMLKVKAVKLLFVYGNYLWQTMPRAVNFAPARHSGHERTEGGCGRAVLPPGQLIRWCVNTVTAPP